MRPKRIILHHSLTADSGTASWGAIRKYHIETNGWKDIGYHFGIELIGDHYEILLGRMINEVGAHTKDQNIDSLGICLVGNFDLAPPPQAQWDAAVILCRGLRSALGIPASNIYGHNQFAEKTCPGKCFDVVKFQRDVMRG